MKTPAIIAATLALLGTTAPVVADTPRTASLRYADLDLASSHGLSTLDRRIDRIARQLCETANERFGNAVRAEQRVCREEIDASVRLKLHRLQPTSLTRR